MMSMTEEACEDSVGGGQEKGSSSMRDSRMVGKEPAIEEGQDRAAHSTPCRACGLSTSGP